MTINKKTQWILHVAGAAMILILLGMLFLPYYPQVRYEEDSTATVKTVLEKECSLFEYAWLPTFDYSTQNNARLTRYTEEVSDYYNSEKLPSMIENTAQNKAKEEYEKRQMEFYTREAMPVVVLTVAGILCFALTLWKMKKQLPVVLFMIYGLLGIWAFLVNPLMWTGGVLAIVLFALYCVLALYGAVLSFLWFAKMARDKEKVVATAVVCVLLAVIIFAVFPFKTDTYGLSFSTATVGAASYGAAPNADDVMLLAKPVFSFFACVAVLLVSVLCYKYCWAALLQLLCGVLCLTMLLVNHTFYSNEFALEAGILCSMLIIVISLMRLLKLVLPQGKKA